VICSYCRHDVQPIYEDPHKRDKLIVGHHSLMPADGGSTKEPTPCPGSPKTGTAQSAKTKVAV